MEQILTALDAVCLASQMILESGGETYRAEETVEKMCQGFGIAQVDVLALPTGLMLTVTVNQEQTPAVCDPQAQSMPDEDGQAQRGAYEENYSRIVRVRNRTIDLGRIDQCNAVSRQVAAGKMTAGEALKQLQQIHQTRKDHRLLLIGASALSAAGFTVMLGGEWTDFFVSFFCGALVQLLLPPLARLRVPTLISSMIAGALTTLMALLGTLVLSPVHVEPVISGAIMPLLPGLATTNAFRDTIKGDLVSGGARVIEAMLCCVMLAAGIGLTLSMWGGMGL